LCSFVRLNFLPIFHSNQLRQQVLLCSFGELNKINNKKEIKKKKKKQDKIKQNKINETNEIKQNNKKTKSKYK
jgi:hypothetical protein